LDPLIKSPIVLQLFQLDSCKPVGFGPIGAIKELRAQQTKGGAEAATLADERADIKDTIARCR
jgi:hypothetical protein